MTRNFGVVLVAGALVASACGGANASPRTAAGVREDYHRLVALVAVGESGRACAEYVAADWKTALATEQAASSCSALFEASWTKGRTVSGAMAALKVVRVNGDRATIKTKRGTVVMSYAGGHWRYDLAGPHAFPTYTVTTTSPDGTSFAISRKSDGSVSRTCHPAGGVGCSSKGTW